LKWKRLCFLIHEAHCTLSGMHPKNGEALYEWRQDIPDAPLPFDEFCEDADKKDEKLFCK
jgi:hypothetical protein